MKKLYAWLAGLGALLALLWSIFKAGENKERAKQVQATLKRREKNKKTFKEIGGKHEEFKRKSDLESARKSFLSS